MGEATLDTQYMMGESEVPEMFYWTTPGWQYEWANSFYSSKTIPESVSISWGWAESGQCQSGIAESECTTLGVDAAGYVARTNTEFQKIGLRGTSLFAASGDSGANGRTDGECTGTTLHASFPGSSPYITAYLGSGVDLPPATYFNSSNRAYPDVAAMGNNFAVYLDLYGGWTTVGGTSASSPTFASIVSYFNSLAKNKTGKPLGFMNPMLYQMAAEKKSTFTDIVSGDNKCTEDGCFSTCKGFECTAGWDPVTGLGTPVATEMMAYIEAQLGATAATLV